MDLRCFIAVRIPVPIRKAVAEVMDILKKSGADVKWVAEENIHITLKFLGSTDEAVIEDIREALYRRVSVYRPFSIRIAGTGYFPPGRRPRVVWIGIEDAGALPDLQRDVEKEMTTFGYEEEKGPFSPHLTIGRVRSDKRMTEMLKRLDAFRETGFGEMEIREITLMKSELRPAGAEYSSLAEIPFGGRKNVEQGEA
jgi:RNA 2',3'-cyclic 3'-phosphodiesterase